MLRVKCVPVGALLSNSYIVFDPESRIGIIIDAGDESEKIIRAVREVQVEIEGIYATHGHFDHVLAVRELKEELGCKFYIHRGDEEILSRAVSEAREVLGVERLAPPRPDKYIEEGDRITLGTEEIKVIHAPGHTPGSVCYLFDRGIFTGDLLFAGSIGRTDLLGGDLKTLVKTIKEKIFKLPDDYVIYPGHGPSSTIGAEKAHNPYVGRFGIL